MSIRQTCEDYKPNAACSFCGTEQWAAMWAHLDGEVYTCRECALTYLPALIADAVGSHLRTRRVSRRALADVTDGVMVQIEARFWRALCLSLGWDE